MVTSQAENDGATRGNGYAPAWGSLVMMMMMMMMMKYVWIILKQLYEGIHGNAWFK